MHKIILNRLKASDKNGFSSMEFQPLPVSDAKGASAAEIAAAELLLACGDPQMEDLRGGLSDEDGDDAHDLVEKIMIYVLSKSTRPLTLILDDAHHCDPTS